MKNRKVPILVDEELHTELKIEAAEKKIKLGEFCEFILKARKKLKIDKLIKEH